MMKTRMIGVPPLVALLLAGSLATVRAGTEMGTSAAQDPFTVAQNAPGYWVAPSPGYPPDEVGYPSYPYPGGYPSGPAYYGPAYGGPIFYGPPIGIGIGFGFGFHGGRR